MALATSVANASFPERCAASTKGARSQAVTPSTAHPGNSYMRRATAQRCIRCSCAEAAVIVRPVIVLGSDMVEYCFCFSTVTSVAGDGGKVIEEDDVVGVLPLRCTGGFDLCNQIISGFLGCVKIGVGTAGVAMAISFSLL